MHPEHGGRVLLSLAHADGDTAEYTARLFAPRAVWSASIRVTPNAIDESAWQPTVPPGWLRDFSLTLLRQARRQQAASPKSGSASRWPRRITRWRNEPTDLSRRAGSEASTGPEASAPQEPPESAS